MRASCGLYCPMCNAVWYEPVVQAHDGRWYYDTDEQKCPNGCNVEPKEIDIFYPEELC